MYALQAAIAACHARACTAAETDWRRIAKLYDTLAGLMPSPIVELNRAVAVAMAFGPAAGLELIDTLALEPSLKSYHLLPSVRGDFLFKVGRLLKPRRSSSAPRPSRATHASANSCSTAPGPAPEDHQKPSNSEENYAPRTLRSVLPRRGSVVVRVYGRTSVGQEMRGCNWRGDEPETAAVFARNQSNRRGRRLRVADGTGDCLSFAGEFARWQPTRIQNAPRLPEFIRKIARANKLALERITSSLHFLFPPI